MKFTIITETRDLISARLTGQQHKTKEITTLNELANTLASMKEPKLTFTPNTSHPFDHDGLITTTVWEKA